MNVRFENRHQSGYWKPERPGFAFRAFDRKRPDFPGEAIDKIKTSWRRHPGTVIEFLFDRRKTLDAFKTRFRHIELGLDVKLDTFKDLDLIIAWFPGPNIVGAR